MKKTILALAVLSISATSFSQVVDYDQVNEQVIREQEANRALKRSKFLNALSDFGNFFVENWDGDFDNTIPKKKNLTEVEEAKVETLKCVEKIVKKRYGGRQFAEISSKILLKIAGINDVDAIDAATEECYDALNNLEKMKGLKDTEANALINTLTDVRIKETLLSLNTPSFYCQVTGVQVTGAALFAVTAGVSKTKCLGTNGVIRKAFGPKLGLGVGVGAMATVYRLYNISPINAGAFLLSSRMENEAVPGQVGIIGSGFTDQWGGEENTSSVGLGVGVTEQPFDAEIGLRMFNGKRRWEVLTSRL